MVAILLDNICHIIFDRYYSVLIRRKMLNTDGKKPNILIGIGLDSFWARYEKLMVSFL